MKSFLKKFWWVIVCFLVAIGLDQLSKFLVFKFLSDGQSVVLIKKLLSIEKVFNEGASFGILKGKIWLFATLTIVAVVCFFVIFAVTKNKESKLFCVSTFLICGGAIGNLIDRFVFKSVRDFIYIHFFPAVFNFADICVTIGTILLVVYLFFYSGKKKEKVS